MAEKRNRRRRRSETASSGRAETRSIISQAGGLSPISDDQCRVIHETALTILDEIGLAEAPEEVIALLKPHGASLDPEGRLMIPPVLIEKAMAELPKQFTLFSRGDHKDLLLGRGHAYLGSGGASPQRLSHDESGKACFRPSTLSDLHDAARLVDALPHIDFFARSFVAGDMPDAESLDINTAYACFSGTTKPVLTSASTAAHAESVISMAEMIAGSGEALRDKPFFGFNINHAVPPLRLDGESCQVIITAVRSGVPVMINTFGQLGASSPVTLAGCLAQTMAETLAGMVIAWAVNPGAKAVFGPRPMITDLRTGGMAGGSGEQALLTAATAQMARFYGWPSSTIAGATDSKTLDAQSGYEKAINISLAVAAGVDLITQAAGAQAGLMAASLAAYVIDNDMLGAIARASQHPLVNDETLALEDIRAVSRGEGHFLGQTMTMARMTSDFTYPEIADRNSIEAWMLDQQPDIIARASARAEEILAKSVYCHIPDKIDDYIRDAFAIRLMAGVMPK